MSQALAETSTIDTAAATPAAPPSGRDARGRFTAGNRGGPGNPHARRVAELKQAVLDALTPVKLQLIVERLIGLALGGDVAAARLLFQYALGKPAEAVDPDRLDVEEWQHFKEQSGMMEEVPRLIARPGPRCQSLTTCRSSAWRNCWRCTPSCARSWPSRHRKETGETGRKAGMVGRGRSLHPLRGQALPFASLRLAL